MEYYTHAEALACLRYISGTKLDERIVRCDLDLGYKEGRQFGRGKSGGQVRDEHRQDYDAGRGGWGAMQKAEQERRAAEEARRKEREGVYADAQEGPGAVAGGGGDWQQSEFGPVRLLEGILTVSFLQPWTPRLNSNDEETTKTTRMKMIAR